MRTVCWVAVVVGGFGVLQARAQTPAKSPAYGPRKDDLLRGGYGPYRANNDLLFYHLKLRVDPEKKTIAGTNVVRFRMLEARVDAGIDVDEHYVRGEGVDVYAGGADVVREVSACVEEG